MSSDFVAIYGGSFDPLHYAHYEIVGTLCRNPMCRQIILMPNYANPLKYKPMFNADERLHMCEAIAKEYNSLYPLGESLPRVIASDYETSQKRPVFSVQSVKAIKQQIESYSSNMRLAFVLGSDSFSGLLKWKQPHILCRLVEFILVERIPCTNYSLKEMKNVIGAEVRILGHITLDTFQNVSSTRVRFLLQNGEIDEALGMLPQSIHNIIKTHFRL